MKQNKDTLSKAIDQIKSEQAVPELPRELADVTVAKLREAAGQPAPAASEPVSFVQRVKSTPNLFRLTIKVAAAAAVFVLAGYIAGRISASRPTDTQQLYRELYSAMEPALRTSLQTEVRNELLEEMSRRWQLAFAKTYLQLKEELGRQYRDDLNRFAAQTLAASNAATNQLLAELVQSIDKAQTQDMRRIAQAIYTVEANRVKDRTEFAKSFHSLALMTDEELQRTKQDVFRLVANVQPDDMTQSPSKILDSPNMRKE